MTNHRHYPILALSALALLTSSCETDDADVAGGATEGVPISISVSPQSLTRYTSISVDELCRAGFTIYIEEVATGRVYYKGNIANIVTSDIDATTGNSLWTIPDVNWPQGKVKFYAISERRIPDTGVATMSFDHDVLVAYAEKSLSEVGPSGVIPLTFDHLYASASITIKLSDEAIDAGFIEAETTSMVLTPAVGNDYDYINRTWSGDPVPISLEYVYDADPAIPAPHSVKVEAPGILAPAYDAGAGPYLFAPGDYELSITHYFYDGTGDRLPDITRTANITLTAGTVQNLTFLLPPPVL